MAGYTDSPSTHRNAPVITTATARPQADGTSGQRATEARIAEMPLESLTPKYESAQHETYLRRLEEAIRDPRNLNIALTGRYGAGKSSVLNEFEAKHRASTQRLAISTLAPPEHGEDKTNRIQKEIVKQLLYGASEKVGKNSRFNKIATLGKGKAALQSLLMVVAAGTLMFLLDFLPSLKWTGPIQPLGVRAGVWVAVIVLVTLFVTTVRLLTYDRLTLSTVAAGGASVALSGKPKSFFDEYLDEIVHYFDTESRDIVIFEDLDRFEDPHIFEALRELNILLNETPTRRKRRQGYWVGRCLRWLLAKRSPNLPAAVAARLHYPWSQRLLGYGVPLQFVYAVKDSVFSQIASGAPTPTKDKNEHSVTARQAPVTTDAAVVETDRANRTKFFDIVIPLVPFISHRNARDLLLELLKRRRITGIDNRLINTLAHHCTDMRLMRNMCNEYLVFAERLLQPEMSNKTPPGMSESHLFALVAYKNFHLEDFENITRRSSALDTLYNLHQRLVRDNISAKEIRKRRLRGEPSRAEVQITTANRLGRRLTQYGELARRANNNGWNTLIYVAGTSDFAIDEVSGYKFWSAVASAQSLTVVATAGQQNRFRVAQMDRAEIETWFPEGLDASRWGEYDEQSVAKELEKIEIDIAKLRHADFAQLVEMVEFKLRVESEAPNAASTEPQSFPDLLNTTLKSELARDLVRRGYLDRNFSLYAAQFYGTFTGTDVANFMVQHVQTRSMAIDYDLSREGAVANLLVEAEESGEDLMQSRAAYNIDIVNHVLGTEYQRAYDFAKHIVTSGPDQHARTFLSAYFTSDQKDGQTLAGLLTEQRWTDVFRYLVNDEGIPADARAHLVSAALGSFDPHTDYALDAPVRDFITHNYRRMPVFLPASEDTTEDDGQLAKRLSLVLGRSNVLIPALAPLRQSIRELVVEKNQYEITADNLRAALNITTDVSLDNLVTSDTVYEYCMSELPAYLSAVDQDDRTLYAVNSAETLKMVLDDLTKDVEEESLPRDDVLALLNHTSPEAQLSEIDDAPVAVWQHLANGDLVHPSLSNVETYRAQLGSIDESLAGLLERTGAIQVDRHGDGSLREGDDTTLRTVAVAILNTPSLDPPLRVKLVKSMGETVTLPVGEITPIGGDLLALLIDSRLIADERSSFDHFRGAGWSSLGPAIRVSSGIATFVTPELLAGLVSEVLHDPITARMLGPTVVDGVDEYVAGDDWLELKAIAHYALARGIALRPDTIARMARVAAANEDVDTDLMLRLLRDSAPPATPDQIVSVFVQLGGEYAKVAQPGAKARLPYDESHTPLMETLKRAGRLDARKAGGRNHYNVNVL